MVGSSVGKPAAVQARVVSCPKKDESLYRKGRDRTWPLAPGSKAVKEGCVHPAHAGLYSGALLRTRGVDKKQVFLSCKPFRSLTSFPYDLKLGILGFQNSGFTEAGCFRPPEDGRCSIMGWPELGEEKVFKFFRRMISKFNTVECWSHLHPDTKELSKMGSRGCFLGG